MADTFTLHHKGFTFRVILERDDDHPLPWEWGDGHGIVSDWRPIESKRPGERILSRDREYARFYDWQATMKIATRDQWGIVPDDPTLTNRISSTSGGRAVPICRNDRRT